LDCQEWLLAQDLGFSHVYVGEWSSFVVNFGKVGIIINQEEEDIIN